MSFSFGSIHSSAATTVGMLSSLWSRLQGEIFGKVQEQLGLSYDQQAEAVTIQVGAIEEEAKKKALETTWNAASGMVSGGLEATIATGSQLYSVTAQSDVTTMQGQLDNINATKTALPAADAVAITPSKPSVDPADPLPVSKKGDTPFRDQFKTSSLDERAEMFSHRSDAPDFFEKTLPKEFAGLSKDKNVAFREDLAEVQKHIETKMMRRENQIQANNRYGQTMAQGIGSVVGNGLKIGAGDAQIAQGEEQVIQTMAENSKNFVKTMQDSLSQMTNMVLQAWNQIQSITQSVYESASRPT